MMMPARYEIRCSRLAPGDTHCMSAPRSSSASARSLCLMSTPLTRATTGSDAEACVSDDELFFEQADTMGTASRSAASAANATGRRRGGLRDRDVGGIMVWSWMKRPSRRAGQLRQTAPLCNHLGLDFDENVSRLRPIDKGLTPSYLCTR